MLGTQNWYEEKWKKEYWVVQIYHKYGHTYEDEFEAQSSFSMHYLVSHYVFRVFAQQNF